MNIEESIKKYALQNAVQFKGKCNPGTVIGKILGEFPDLKKNMKEISSKIQEIVKEVNLLSEDKQCEELENLAPELLEKKKGERREGLKDLKEVNKLFKIRLAPAPSGPLHIGHAYGFSLNYEYKKKYTGELCLRFEDTNPENIYPAGYDMISDDVNWLTDNDVDEIIYQSERLDLYYDSAEKLINLEKAYVCTCDNDEWKTKKNDGISCSCRDLNIKEQRVRFAKMFDEFSEGEAVLRLKTDLNDKNPAMRDFAIMRINEHIHPRTAKKHRVWPLMVLSVAIDDHETNITHILNGKEHIDNIMKERIIMNYLGWKPPEHEHWGMINFKGFEVSTSKTKIKIEQNEYEGWDDIRLPFLAALRRRGYQAETFRKFAVEIGLTLNDKTVEIDEFWKNINTLNRQIIEPTAKRFFFIEEPVEIIIKDAPSLKMELDLHPDHEKGGRKFNVGNAYFIQKSDFESLKEMENIRLMDCLNFIKKNDIFEFTSLDYETFKNKGRKIIHWLPDEGNLNVEILMPNNQILRGLGESNISKIKINEIIQFERFGFCKLDSIKDNIYKFWFTHK